jgi:RNA polymerase sigma factor (TIGR02999 family)
VDAVARRLKELNMTQILHAIAEGDPSAADQLLPLVYDELRQLAAHRLAHQTPGLTLQPTALVHEAYLRLVGDAYRSWDHRGHFFAAAAEAMRRILIENARRKGRYKRGGGLTRRDVDAEEVAVPEIHEDLLALDEALTKLASANPQAARLVELRYFAGLPIPEVAHTLGVSPRTADRLWAFARAWLLREVSGDAPDRSAT